METIPSLENVLAQSLSQAQVANTSHIVYITLCGRDIDYSFIDHGSHGDNIQFECEATDEQISSLIQDENTDSVLMDILISNQ